MCGSRSTACRKQRARPTYLRTTRPLLAPQSRHPPHGISATYSTLYCVAQGFFFLWPILFAGPKPTRRPSSLTAPMKSTISRNGRTQRGRCWALTRLGLQSSISPKSWDFLRTPQSGSCLPPTARSARRTAVTSSKPTRRSSSLKDSRSESCVSGTWTRRRVG